MRILLNPLLQDNAYPKDFERRRTQMNADKYGIIMKIFLETPGLLLRQFTLDDAQNLLDLDSDIEVIRYVDLGIIKSDKPL